MNIKKIVVRLILTLIMLGGSMYICQTVIFENYETSSAITTDYQDLEDLAQATPIVITAQAKNKGEIFTYHDVEFVKTKIQVQDILRDETKLLKKGENITLLQTYVKEDPTVKRNEKVLLFLEQYEGKVIDELAYTVNGLEQGHFKIKNGEIISKSKNSKIKDNTKGKNLDDTKQVLRTISYDKNAQMAEPMPESDKQKFIEMMKKVDFTDEQIDEEIKKDQFD